jgi:hypothetical protein
MQVQMYYDRANRHEPNFGENRKAFDLDYIQRRRLPRGRKSPGGSEPASFPPLQSKSFRVLPSAPQ